VQTVGDQGAEEQLTLATDASRELEETTDAAAQQTLDDQDAATAAAAEMTAAASESASAVAQNAADAQLIAQGVGASDAPNVAGLLSTPAAVSPTPGTFDGYASPGGWGGFSQILYNMTTINGHTTLGTFSPVTPWTCWCPAGSGLDGVNLNSLMIRSQIPAVASSGTSANPQVAAPGAALISSAAALTQPVNPGGLPAVGGSTDSGLANSQMAVLNCIAPSVATELGTTCSWYDPSQVAASTSDSDSGGEDADSATVSGATSADAAGATGSLLPVSPLSTTGSDPVTADSSAADSSTPATDASLSLDPTGTEEAGSPALFPQSLTAQQEGSDDPTGQASIQQATLADGTQTSPVSSSLSGVLPASLATMTRPDLAIEAQEGVSVPGVNQSPTSDSQLLTPSSTDALGNTTSLTYDANGNLAGLTDPDGNTTTWTYNQSNQVTSQTDALGATTTYAYNAAGQLVQMTDADGHVNVYTYDSQGLLATETWYADAADAAAGQNPEDVFHYAYDSASHLTAESDDSVGQVSNLSSSSSDLYTYDSQGRETSVTESSTGGPTVVLTYQYTGDATQPTTVSATIDGVADYQDTYTYNAQGQVTSITQSGQSGGNAVANVSASLTYDASGNLTNLTRSVNGQVAVSAGYSYDTQGDLTGLSYSQNSTVLDPYSYTYADDGVPASASSSVESPIPNPQSLVTSATTPDGTVNYTYDADGQLNGATYGGSQPDESYTYDANGNRTGGGYVTGADNELLSDGTYNYSYDADGNRIERTNIATGAVTDYVWDNRDRLVEVIDRASAGGAITQDVHYFYDAQNRWIGQTVSTPGRAVQETSFAYAGNQIVLQFDGTSNAGSTGSASPLTVASLSHRYLWGPAVDQILAGEQVTSLSQPGNVLLPLTNNQGTVCDLAQYNPQTGTTSVVDHRVYDSFGNLKSQTNSAVDFLFGFAGMTTDPVTGDSVTDNRVYDPLTGTWLSKDPTGVEAGDANAYRYCGNDATNGVDPTGLAWWNFWICDSGAASGEAIGTGYGAVLNSFDKTLAVAKLRQERMVRDMSDPNLPANSRMNTSEFARERNRIMGGGLSEAGDIGAKQVKGAAATAELTVNVVLTVEGGASIITARRAAMAAGSQVANVITQEGHIVLGLRNQGLAATAERIGARHLLESGDFREAVVAAAKNSNVKISVVLDGLEGATPELKVLNAVQDGLENGMANSFTNWEMSVLSKYGRLPGVDFYLNGKLISNPF
ncbi:MAG: RHS repeat domain-containing protein, partial [Thermoguttaceae bacterium]